MSIPCNISPLSYNALLPADYAQLDFLESVGQQCIDTELKVPINSTVEVVAQYTSHHTTHQALFGWRKLNGSIALLVWVTNALNPPYFYSVINAYEQFIVLASETLEKFKLRYEYGRVQFNDIIKTVATPTPAEPADTFVLFGAKRDGALYCRAKARIWNAKISDSQGVMANYMPALAPNGEPCMYDTVARRARKNVGTGQFVVGIGAVAQLHNILTRLPATGGKLTLSLPAEANTPEVAEALQACYDTKGWTLTVHEYRPAAAATYSLRRVRSMVWVRCARVAHGAYVAADGTRWQLDRCAAIFGEHGNDPEAYGYAPYDSVDQAAEEWGFTPYIEPEMEEQP